MLQQAKENKGIDNELVEEQNGKDEEIKKFIKSQKSKNTVIKPSSDINIFKVVCPAVNEIRELEDISVQELDNLLSKFFIKAKRNAGDEYKTNAQSSIQRSIQWYLGEKTFNLIF